VPGQQSDSLYGSAAEIWHQHPLYHPRRRSRQRFAPGVLHVGPLSLPWDLDVVRPRTVLLTTVDTAAFRPRISKLAGRPAFCAHLRPQE